MTSLPTGHYQPNSNKQQAPDNQVDLFLTGIYSAGLFGGLNCNGFSFNTILTRTTKSLVHAVWSNKIEKVTTLSMTRSKQNT